MVALQKLSTSCKRKNKYGRKCTSPFCLLITNFTDVNKFTIENGPFELKEDISSCLSRLMVCTRTGVQLLKKKKKHTSVLFHLPIWKHRTAGWVMEDVAIIRYYLDFISHKYTIMTTSHCYIAHVVFVHITEIVSLKIQNSFHVSSLSLNVYLKRIFPKSLCMNSGSVVGLSKAYTYWICHMTPLTPQRCTP